MIRPRKLLISRSKTPPTINTNGTFNYFKRALYASLTRICVYEITVIFDSAHRIQIELIRFPTFGNHRRERENEFTTQARKKRKKRPNKIQRRKLRSTAYKNGDLRDKNSTNTCVKIEARYRHSLPSPSPLLFYLPLPSRSSIVSSRYLPTNFAFKVPRDIPLFSSSSLPRRSGSVPLKIEIGVVIPPLLPPSNVSKMYRGFVATNRVSGLMAGSRRGATMPAPPEISVSVLIRGTPLVLHPSRKLQCRSARVYPQMYIGERDLRRLSLSVRGEGRISNSR